MALWLLFAFALFVATAWWASRPQRVAALILDRAGAALGLEITAAGASEYRLRGTPMLVLRDVVVRERGAAVMLDARRILIALPWSTLRARGADLTVKRIELDAPRLDLPALQRWLARRPPAERRVPTLVDGLRIRDGRVANDDWRVDGLQIDLPSLHPDRMARMRLQGRYLDPPLAIPVDLAVAVARPGALVERRFVGFATVGRITVERAPRTVPAAVTLSGPLRLGEDDLRIGPARLGIAGRYLAPGTVLPFALGAHGPLRFDEAVWTLAPATVALRGEAVLSDGALSEGVLSEGALPHLDARGSVALGHSFDIDLSGRLPAWPSAWPALPAPLDRSDAPLPFALRYSGAPDFSERVTLRLERDDARFDGTFRVPQVQAWIDGFATGTPLPPLHGRVSAPTLEIAGAQLQGVEIEFDDDGDAP